MTLASVFAPLWVCLVIALMSSCISITVTQQEMFRPFREWTQKKGAMIGYLFRCFYCFSHWVVFAGIAIYRPVLISSGFYLIDLAVSAFFTVGLAALFSGLIFKVMRNAIAKAVEEHDMKAKLHS